MNTSNIKKKMDLLKRKHKGSVIFPNWRDALGKVCGVIFTEKDFLPIEETDKIKDDFFQKVRLLDNSSCYPRSDVAISCIKKAMVETSRNSHDLAVVLFSQMDKYVGAVRLPAPVALINAFDIWGVAGEDFAMTTSDLQHGVCLEVNYYSNDGNYTKNGVFELTSWGRLSCRISSGDTILNSEKRDRKDSDESGKEPREKGDDKKNEFRGHNT